jgi:hypothetical protein
MVSSKDVAFMKRSMPDAFVPGRNIGIQIYNDAFDKCLCWAVGGFQE